MHDEEAECNPDWYDAIKHNKSAVISPDAMPDCDPVDEWMKVVGMYTSTSVTNKDDRLIAIAGLAGVFRSTFKSQLREAIYHSGVWSEGVIRQLLWSRNWRVAPERRIAAKKLPSWSPLSCQGKVKHEEARYLNRSRESWLPLQLMAMGHSQPDQFGRGRGPNGCTLHLRGFLVKLTMTRAESSKSFSGDVYPSNHEDMTVWVDWDNLSEWEMASTTATPQNYLWGLVCFFHPSKWSKILGIVLRPEDSSAIGDNAQKWVRCGAFTYNTSTHGEIWDAVQEAFEIRKYGVKWTNDELESEDGAWKRETIPERFPRQDIYII